MCTLRKGQSRIPNYTHIDPEKKGEMVLDGLDLLVHDESKGAASGTIHFSGSF